MNIVCLSEPNRSYEVQGYTDPADFREILDWCRQMDLPERLTLHFQGKVFGFDNRDERVTFGKALNMAHDLMADEPQLPVVTEDDGTVYLQLTYVEDGREKLRSLADMFLRELHASRWVEHLDDFRVYPSKYDSLLIKQRVWKALSLRQKHSLADRCQGFSDAFAV